MTQTEFMNDPKYCTKEALAVLIPAAKDGTISKDETAVKVLVQERKMFCNLTLPLAALPEPAQSAFIQIKFEQLLPSFPWLFSLKEQTEEECIRFVRRVGENLQFIKEQTPAICLAAVKNDSEALRFVPAELQTEEMGLAAVEHNPWTLFEVAKQTEKICRAAIAKSVENGGKAEDFPFVKVKDLDLQHRLMKEFKK